MNVCTKRGEPAELVARRRHDAGAQARHELPADHLKAEGDGRYRAEGLLFHMPGRWEVAFDVRAGEESERLTHDFILQVRRGSCCCCRCWRARRPSARARSRCSTGQPDEVQGDRRARAVAAARRCAIPATGSRARRPAIALGEHLFNEPRLSGDGA